MEFRLKAGRDEIEERYSSVCIFACDSLPNWKFTESFRELRFLGQNEMSKMKEDDEWQPHEKGKFLVEFGMTGF